MGSTHAETEKLKKNAEDQITRLLTQMQDLEELREVRNLAWEVLSAARDRDGLNRWK